MTEENKPKTEMAKQLRWYQFNPEMSTRQIRMGNRFQGLCGLALAFMGVSVSLYALPIALPLVVDGMGDIITGEHHYLGSKLFKRLGIGRSE
jgi:hypothetical protein